MVSLKELLCVFLSLFQLIQGNVPVLMWESSKSDRVNTFSAFHPLSKNEFLQYFLKKVHGEQPLPLIAVFPEERLSIEDFSWQDSQGQGYFPQIRYISENAANAEFLPLVQDPIGAVNQLSHYEFSVMNIDPNDINDLPDGCGKILIFKLPEAKPEEDRSGMLRRHDVKIAEGYSQLLSKCSRVIGVMSGQQPSWVEPEEVTRLRRSTEENTTAVSDSEKTLYKDPRGNSMLYSSKVPSLMINGQSAPLQNSSIVVSGDNSKPNDIKLFVKYNNEYRLSFNFDNYTLGYWYLRSVDLTLLTGPEQNKNFNLKSTRDIYAPLGMSYHCGSNVTFRNITKENDNIIVKELTFSDLQVEPFFFKSGPGYFSEAVDEVPFFTPAIWSGIFVTFLLALIFTWGLSMIMDIRTMDQFDDPKGKTITVSATD